VVLFGLQYFLQRFLMDDIQQDFFDRPKDEVLAKYARRINGYLGPNQIGVDHVADLHDLGYLPLRFSSLPEGTLCPLRVPMFVVENTLDEFFWLTNCYETLASTSIWQPCTSATTAYRFRKMLNHYAQLTGTDPEFVGWQGHDFSMRGLPGIEAAAASGAAHLLSFVGTDTIPSLDFIEQYYWGNEPEDYLIGGSVAATEHSVMCAGGHKTELETFERLLDLYPTGIVSVVSDTWDLWKVCTEILPKLKDKIMARDGKLVIRPDSGNPADILCGDPEARRHSPVNKGVVELLWDVFGGTTNGNGFRMLDEHIGTIYGDAITYDRGDEIMGRLARKGFASGNAVFGVGSFSYQYVTRDTYGFAMKATWADVNGEERNLFKKPITDNGEKFSATGRLAVKRYEPTGEIYVVEEATPEDEAESLMQPKWEDGKFLTRTSISQIRETLWS
jgi:nicotinamide phosphoribosyltransferase